MIALVFAFTNAVKADIALSGYVEFFAGSADQAKLRGSENHGVDVGP